MLAHSRRLSFLDVATARFWNLKSRGASLRSWLAFLKRVTARLVLVSDMKTSGRSAAKFVNLMGRNRVPARRREIFVKINCGI